ncbi:peptide/nickel transport system ATP-binding protein [Actinomadura meyerae]|uniref:Peptide/nickel transport system ATP-binding protein n=1 Tax=Actinomadura meyerae TaxID=240840 RepID=A0A239NUI6_9ACTN|nr:ABC transporter ATP-binding protein [Actinomadura meyerae]SNT58537.1 peptide/nickel transport system ATP-binding protein [Actinomadura meyerae]
MATTGTVPHADTTGDAGEALLEVQDLAVSIGGHQLLSEVSLTVRPGQMVGLVGESGSGKTLTGLSLLGLLPAHASVRGSVRFDGVDVLKVDEDRLRRIRGSEISMIFQEPRASLHPSRPVGKQLVDVIRAHEPVRVADARRRAVDMLGMVGLPNPRRTMDSYIHQLSGGMCQRVLIAMALVCRPRLLVADEPTTALDVTIQAQVVALLRRLARELDLGVLLITHNLGVVSALCSRVVTMYCGQVVNDDDAERLLSSPQHPYTAALVRASDVSLENPDDWSGIAGAPANPAHPPEGCRFHPRCPYAEERCGRSAPALEPARHGGRTRCLRSDDLVLPGVGA